MRPRLVIVFVLLILAPLAAIGWLGVKTARDEREIVSHRLLELLSQRLADIDGTVSKVVEERERQLLKLTDMEEMDAPTLREIVRNEPTIRQVFVLDPSGRMVHPPLDSPRNAAEEEFLERTDHIWASGESFFKPGDSEGDPGGGGDHGWYTWYRGDGVNFIFWRRESDGHIVGAQVDRLMLLADIVGELPETRAGESDPRDGRIQLVDADGAPVYVWGTYEPADGERPAASRELPQPLGAWRLYYYTPDGPKEGPWGGVVMTTILGLGALVLVIVALAVYFFRESGRDAREARQRVTFVNQVSHELKTPLTNIRMYAELLDDQVEEEDEQSRRYLDVIVSESQRLSRLIGNVLTFARKQRKKLAVRPSPGRIDESIRATVEQFGPSLEEAGFEIVCELEPDEVSAYDADALGQIVANLLGNVEKYAAGARWVRISSQRIGDEIEIRVEDRGPGIPPSSRKAIFEPFVRLSQKVDEGVSGTGIGLPISRDLARLHGGDLDIEPSKSGARFRLRIAAPLERSDKR